MDLKSCKSSASFRRAHCTSILNELYKGVMSDQEETKQKRPRQEVDSGDEQATSTPSSPMKVNAEGEKYWDLGAKKRATVRQWKGKTLVDIREFYGEDNDLKPGKKGKCIYHVITLDKVGISLSLEQWKKLVEVIQDIDSLCK